MKNPGDRLDRAKSGDRAAFEALVATHREGLKRFVATMCGDDAEDVAQEAIAVAFSKLEDFEGRSNIASWLYGIALNLCRHRLRDRKRHAKLAGSGVLEEARARRGVLSSLYRRELVDRLDKAIEALPVSLREAFALHYMEGLGYDDIAVIAGTSAGTARVRAHRARALLKDALGGLVDPNWKIDENSS